MAGSSAGGGSIEYKEQFDALASVLSEFPLLLSAITLLFVPGDNDPWASSFSAGAATAIPREGIPEIFTSRIRRAVATANAEMARKETDRGGEAIWASNPARMSLFGPVEELVVFRDDITGRLRRSAIMFSKLDVDRNDVDPSVDTSRDSHLQTNGNGTNEDADSMEIDMAVRVPSKPVTTSATEADTHTARKLVKTVLDQGYLSPFPLSTRPVYWDFASALSLYPLPTALILADAEAPAFAVTYEGCHVMNPGRVVDELGGRRGVAKWVEYDIKNRRGVIKEVRF